MLQPYHVVESACYLVYVACGFHNIDTIIYICMFARRKLLPKEIQHPMSHNTSKRRFSFFLEMGWWDGYAIKMGWWDGLMGWWDGIFKLAWSDISLPTKRPSFRSQEFGFCMYVCRRKKMVKDKDSWVPTCLEVAAQHICCATHFMESKVPPQSYPMVNSPFLIRPAIYWVP